MRTEDIKHYFKLCGMVENSWQVVRFRKRRSADDQLAVTFRDGRRLVLCGLSSDFYIFREIFLRDAYRLDGPLTYFDCALVIGSN